MFRSFLDPLGFGITGYEKAKANFKPLESRPGLVVAITGANSGLGLCLAKGLVQHGCTVYMLCRNLEKGEEARKEVLSCSNTNKNVFISKLDVSSLSSISELSNLPSNIDVLVQNAGAIQEKFELSTDGHEMTCATGLIGPYVLRDKLKPKKCIWITSGGAYSQSLSTKEIFSPSSTNFDGVTAYANCKRGQISLARMLGDDVMHPGWSETPGVKHSLPKFYEWTKSILRTPEQGVDTSLWLILDSNNKKERNFWFDRTPVKEHMWWARTKSSPEEEKNLMSKLNEILSVTKTSSSSNQ